MGKVSFAYKDFAKGGFGIQAGKYEVLGAKLRVVQPNPNKAGEQANPFTAMQFDLAKLSDDWERVSDEVVEHQFAIAFTQEEDGTLKLKCRPGKADSATDDDPEDLGKDKEVIELVDIEGNCLVADDGYKPWGQAPWALFIESLEAKAFKPEVNAQGFAPNYIGMKFSCLTKELAKPKNWKKDQPPTALVCDGIRVFPWDVKKGGTKAKTAASTKTATASSGANGADKSEPAGDDPAMTALNKFIKGHSGKTMKKLEFQKFLGQDLMNIKEVGMKGAQAFIAQYFKNADEFSGLGMVAGFDVSDDGNVTFG